jgi:sigma-54 specific flagellar transcriptional regulator A
MSILFKSALVGSSPSIINFNLQLDAAIAQDTLVVLLGDSATGKESAAFKLYQKTTYGDAPFLSLDCSTIELELIESELFGHVAGAFSGAIRARSGRLEMASGGAIFIDEIQLMPEMVRIKLFHAIEQGFYYPLGSERPSILSAKIVLGVSITPFFDQAWLEMSSVFSTQFGITEIVMPSLPERLDDLEALFAGLYLAQFSASLTPPMLSSETLDALKQYPWSANFHDLRALVELLGDGLHGQVIKLVDLPERYRFTTYDAQSEINLFDTSDGDLLLDQAQPDFEALSDCWGFNDSWAPANSTMVEVNNFDFEANQGLKTYLQQVELSLIVAAFDRCEHNVSQAAKLLKLNRTTLIEKMRKYGINQ